MQVFLTNEDLAISAMELDDLRLNKQITEINQIILACYNNKNAEQHGRNIVIGHINHPITQWYNSEQGIKFLIEYQYELCYEYEYRFYKNHMGYYTLIGLGSLAKYYPNKDTNFKPVYIKGQKGKDQIITTENIYELYRNLLCEKWSKDKTKPKWTNRQSPKWYKEEVQNGN